MRRYTLTSPVLTVLLCVFASMTTTHAAQRVARIGVLCAPSCSVATMTAFWDELRKIGWIEGTNIVVERKEAGAHMDQFPALAAELVQSKPDLIVATNPQSARAAKDVTSNIPIAFFGVADPVGMGLASSLAHPGGNMTGAATLDGANFIGKVFGLIRELLPQAKRVTAIINSANEAHRLLYVEKAPSAADKLGFELDTVDLHNAEELPGAVAAAKVRGADVLYLLADPMFIFPPNRVPDLAAQAQLPSISLLRDFAQSGGLISYGPDFPAVARLGAHYVDRILKGAKSADLPIEQPSKYVLVINLKTARSLGIEVPASLLASADEVIE
jgi:putative tryptophan/tyrosine transport system substrate-binding protein